MSSDNLAIDMRRRAIFSPRAMELFSVVTMMTFAAGSSALTPLYHVYQTTLGLSPLLVMLIFSSYAFSLLAALLTVGSLSDFIGRRPVILGAILVNAIAMLVFATADSPVALITGRIIQGVATGAALTSLGATIVDTDRKRGPLLNSITPFLGLAIGTFAASVLVTFAPLPTRLVFALLLGIFIIEAGMLLLMPETTMGRAGAIASLRPHIEVPMQARRALVAVTPVNVAAWALGGFYLSLMPTLVAVATHLTSLMVGAAVVAALMLAAAFPVLAFRNIPAVRVLAHGTALLASGVAITLGGVYLEQVWLLIAGTIVAGVGFGAAFSGALRAVLPLATAEERAGLLSTFYVESYLAFSLPAVGAGLLAPMLGMVATTYLYGALVMLLAGVSFVAARTTGASR